MEITKKSHWNILTTFGLLGIICLQNDVKAEDTPVDLSNLPELGTNVLNSGGSALIVTAGTEKKTAYFRFGGNPTKTNLWKWDIAVETPLRQK